MLIGEIIGGMVEKGMVIALFGEMGAGKTKLTQGIAMGLSVAGETPVASPTFTLVNEYRGAITLYHIDLYRLSTPDELYDLGYEEYFYGDGVAIVEWAERARNLLPRERIDIAITIVDEYTRRFHIVGREHEYSSMNGKLLYYNQKQRGEKGNSCH